MSGTKAGGLKASETNRKKFGKDFYKRIGAKGGSRGHNGGFAANPVLARLAGAKGGRLSKRGPAVNKPKTKYLRELNKKYKGVTVGDVLNGHVAIDVTDKIHFVKGKTECLN